MDNLQSRIILLARNRMMGRAILEKLREFDLSSTIRLRINNDLQGKIGINPHSRMVGVAEVIQPPTTKEIFAPVADAFIRDGVPKLNYGVEEDIFIGRSGGGEVFRSFIRFDISTLPPGQIIKRAELVLYPASTNYTNELGLYEIGSSWNEYSVTWDNQPSNLDLVGVFNSGINETITVDVTDIVTSWYKQTKVNNGLLIKALDETNAVIARYYARESYLPPQLVVYYYNPSIQMSVGRGNLAGTIIVKKEESNDLISEIQVKSYWGKSELPAKLNVSDPTSLDCTIRVNKPNLISSINVIYTTKDNLESTVKVALKSAVDCLAFIAVSRDFISGNINVPHHNDLMAAITVRSGAVSDLLGWAGISRSVLNGIIEVPNRNDLHSTVVVYNLTGYNTPSQIWVPLRYNIPARLEVIGASKLLSSIIVVSGFIASTITVIRKESSDLAGQVTVRYASYEETVSSLSVRHSSYDDVSSSLVVYIVGEKDLLGVLSVRGTSNLESFIIIKQESYKDLIGYVQPIYHNDVESEVVVKQLASTDLDSILLSRRADGRELPGVILSRVKFANDLQAEIYVFRFGAYAFIM
ncbi:hypothetical protein E308F_30230 [Moorella sp. E308F]|uniref:DNRLRE domain-containing protein n=1 Tax=Moorella sp. E308F TaxID=2572682 RepID=UPI0010FFB10C|nr:DNRLRE domain-containing protein [Moorella sp. E308F]GEA16777.1 hypothetical protein E308F_30230 [Moorella sp. E308F]